MSDTSRIIQIISFVARFCQNIFMTVFAYKTITFFIRQKRLKLQRQKVTMSQNSGFSYFNLFIISVLATTFLMRFSTYLTIDQINIVSLLMPMCHSYTLYIIWNIEKAFIVPLKDFLDVALLGYLVLF